MQIFFGNTKMKGLGGSDAAMLLSLDGKTVIGNEFYHKRLLYLLDMGERPHVPTTPEMQAGIDFEHDYFHDRFFNEHLEITNKVGTPQATLVRPFSDKLPIKLLAKADYAYLLNNEDFNEIYNHEIRMEKKPEEEMEGVGVFELKYSALSTEEILKHYMPQLQWYYFIGAKKVTLLHAMRLAKKEEVPEIKEVEIQEDEEMQIHFLDAIFWLIDNILPQLVYNIKTETCTTPAFADIPKDMQKIMTTFEKLKREEANIKVKLSEIEPHLLEYLENNKISKILWEKADVSYINASVSRTFDKEKLFKDHPELDVADYYKDTKRSASVRIKLK